MAGGRLRLTSALGAALLSAVAATSAGAQVQIPLSSGLEGVVGVVSWRDIPFRTVVRQKFDFSCGSAALATLLTYQYGQRVSETDAFKAMFAAGDQAKIRRVGFSMLDMKRYLAGRGLHADGFRLGLDGVARMNAPAIALIQLGRYRHFVVIKGVAGDRVLVGDPALGLKIYSRADFAKLWNGVAFMLDPGQPRLQPVFNARAEWTPWSRAPLQDLENQTIPLAELSRNLAPVYQLTPTLIIPGVPANGVP